ncbi:hypothetical protein [Streptomyces sp. NPDC059142]
MQRPVSIMVRPVMASSRALRPRRHLPGAAFAARIVVGHVV